MSGDRILANQKGLALVLTLLTISFLVAVTIHLMMIVDRQVAVATAQRERVRLDGMVLAGLNLARAALAADLKENEFESPHDAWAQLSEEKLKAVSDEVVLAVTVTDLGGRLQVLALGDSAKEGYRQVWLRFLLSGRFAITEQDEAEALLDAIGDWIDQDDDERQQGAEEGYYQGLNPPYACRNGPITTIDELSLIKGMTPELLYGDAKHEGLAGYISVVGNDGMIHLNAAPALVLQALSPNMTLKLAQELIEFREDPRHVKLLSTLDWYRQVRGFPVSIEMENGLLAVVGKHFEVKVKATHHQFSRTGTGVLLRENEQKQTLLQWKQE
jgi:general secretion pathway protein K